MGGGPLAGAVIVLGTSGWDGGEGAGTGRKGQLDSHGRQS